MRKIILDKGEYLEQKRKKELKKKGEEIKKKFKKRKNKGYIYFESEEDVFKYVDKYLCQYQQGRVTTEQVKRVVDEALYCGIHINKKEIFKLVGCLCFKYRNNQKTREKHSSTIINSLIQAYNSDSRFGNYGNFNSYKYDSVKGELLRVTPDTKKMGAMDINSNNTIIEILLEG